MSEAALVDTRTSRKKPSTHGSSTGFRAGVARHARELPASPLGVRLSALLRCLLLTLGALAVVTAYALLPLVAALRASAVTGVIAVGLAVVVVTEASLAVAFIILKTEGKQ